MDAPPVRPPGGRRRPAVVALSALLTAVVGCTTVPVDPAVDAPGRDADSLLVVDCLLPGQLRRLGQIMAFVTPQRPIRTSASVCEIRGGEYVAYDRANFATALKTWLPKAEEGDPEAQTYVGEIYEKGLGLEPDLEVAVDWYTRAAEQGFSRARINLGFLYESGLGVERDLTRAMNYYRAASGFTEAKLEYVTSIEAASRQARKRQLVDLQSQVDTLEAANAELRREQASLATRERELAELRARVEAQRARVVESAAASDATEGPDGDARLAASLADIADIGRRLETSEAEQRRLFARLAEQNAATSEIRRKYAAVSVELSHARDAVRTREARATALLERISALESSGGEADAADAERRAALEAELAEERVRVQGLTAERERLQASQSAESRAIEERLARAEAGEAELSGELDEREARIGNLRAELAERERDYRRQLDELRGQVTSLAADNAGLQSELGRRQDEVDEARLESDAAAAELESATASMAAEEARRQARIDELQARLDEANGRLADAAGADEAERRRVASLAEDLEGQLERATAEQKRLLERLMSTRLDARERDESAAEELARLERELGEKERVIAAQQSDIGELQAEVTRNRAGLDQPEIEQILRVVEAGPVIEIIEPPTLLTRSRPALSTSPGSSVMNVIGRVDPAERLLSLQINGAEGEVNANGVFKYRVDLESGEALRMVAVDDAGQRTEMAFDLLRGGDEAAAPEPAPAPEREAPPPEPIAFGNYHALIVGNNRYEHLQDLRTAENDAIAVEKLLRTRYGFDTELLLNATRYDLLSALNRKRDELTDQDNLLIYYAGHGELSNAKGYWMPVDAEPDNTSNWIANSSITDLVESMRAKHVMIMADSCYSGSLTRASLTRLDTGMTEEQRTRWYRTVSSLKVRTVFTSGGVKPVLDSTAGAEHSLFAEALLDELGRGSGVVQAYDLFLNVRDRVKTEARKLTLEQNPQYSPIRFAGHESGEFMFVTAEAASRSASRSTSRETRPATGRTLLAASAVRADGAPGN